MPYWKHEYGFFFVFSSVGSSFSVVGLAILMGEWRSPGRFESAFLGQWWLPSPGGYKYRQITPKLICIIFIIKNIFYMHNKIYPQIFLLSPWYAKPCSWHCRKYNKRRDGLTCRVGLGKTGDAHRAPERGTGGNSCTKWGIKTKSLRGFQRRKGPQQIN